MAKILNGKVVRDKIAQDLKKEIAPRARGPRSESETALRRRLGRRPKLVIIQVGNLAESNTYIRQKSLFGQKIGAIVEHKKFGEKISQKDLISQLSILNSQLDTHGIIIQLPIPKKLDCEKIIDNIYFKKDVDGLTSINTKLLWENNPIGLTPATTKGALSLLDYYKIPISGKKVVVVGRSFLVGKPTAIAFLNSDATVTICHRYTRNLKQETKNADILVVAAGKPNLITKDHVSKNQVVIDIGINVIENEVSPRNQDEERPRSNSA